MTRAGCHLCEQAEPLVRSVCARLEVACSVLDVDTDDELVRLFALRIPVVLGPDGEVLAEGMIDERPLRRSLSRRRRRARHRWMRRDGGSG
ncbi:MAG TPA: glutaredoxin family protein [Longimicrobiales bacterium]|nr:glutaredoxin family protein [Longimicrobiales bacterium]